MSGVRQNKKPSSVYARHNISDVTGQDLEANILRYTVDCPQQKWLDRILALIGECGGADGGDQGAAGLIKADIGDSGKQSPVY